MLAQHFSLSNTRLQNRCQLQQHNLERLRRWGCRRGRLQVAGASGQSTPTADALKADIRKLIAGTARGRKASIAQRQMINQLVMQLEANNPTPVDPAKCVDGWWTLLYQASLKEEPGKPADKSTTVEGPFLATFQPLTKDLVRTRSNLQLLDTANGRAENIAEFVAFGIDGSLNIQGKADLMEPPNTQGATRIFVEFKEFLLNWGLLKLRMPLSWVKPTGWVETTYIDADGWRVGRGDKGSIFVTSRTASRDITQSAT